MRTRWRLASDDVIGITRSRFCLQNRGAYLRLMSAPSGIDWVAKAAEARLAADEERDPVLREALLKIAAGYDKMVEPAALPARKKIGRW